MWLKPSKIENIISKSNKLSQLKLKLHNLKESERQIIIKIFIKFCIINLHRKFAIDYEMS